MRGLGRYIPCHVLSPPPSFPQFEKKQLGRIRWRYRVAGVALKVGKRRVGRVRHLKGYRFRKQVLQLKGFQSQRIPRWWQPRGGTWLVRDYAAISLKARTKSKNHPHPLRHLFFGGVKKCKLQTNGGDPPVKKCKLHFRDPLTYIFLTPPSPHEKIKNEGVKNVTSNL